MCSAPSSSEPQSFGVTAEKMHHGLVNSACRKTPPLRRMTRRRSESASIGRKPRGGHLGFRCPEQDIRRARHSSVAPFRLYPPADKQLCSGAFGPSWAAEYDAGDDHENPVKHNDPATKRRNPAERTIRQAAVLVGGLSELAHPARSNSSA